MVFYEEFVVCSRSCLICISIFSCEQKAVISPLNEDFKITTFSPISGFNASDVTLFGENLTKDSIVSVSFGDQTAEILSRSSDSLIVKVPRIVVGKYDITVKTKTKSYVYDKQYEVLQQSFLDDLTQIKNYEFSVKGFKVRFQDESSYQDYPTGGGNSNSMRIDSNFAKNYKNHYSLSVQEIGANIYKIREMNVPQKFAAQFEIDFKKKKFITLKLDSYYSTGESVSHGTVKKQYNFSLDLTDLGFEVNENDSIIIVQVSRNDINTKLKNLYFDYYQEYRHTYRPSWSITKYTFKELLGLRDNATIEIKFTK